MHKHGALNGPCGQKSSNNNLNSTYYILCHESANQLDMKRPDNKKLYSKHELIAFYNILKAYAIKLGILIHLFLE